MSHEINSKDSFGRKKKLIVAGDRVLIKPDDENKTRVGLLLPQDAIDKKQVRGGTVIATGPGTPLPDPNAHEDESWKPRPNARFMPVQTRTDDYVLFFRRSAVDITYDGEDYVLVPEGAVLLILRDEDDVEPEATPDFF